MTHKIILTTLAFLLCITAGAKAQTGDYGLELVWEKEVTDKTRSYFGEFSEDGNYVYAKIDSVFYKLNASDGSEVMQKTLHYDQVGLSPNEYHKIRITAYGMKRNFDGNYLIGCSSPGKYIVVWNTVTDDFEKIIRFDSLENEDLHFEIKDFELSPNSNQFYLLLRMHDIGDGSYNKLLKYDYERDSITYKTEDSWAIEYGIMEHLAIHPDGNYFVTGSSDFYLHQEPDIYFKRPFLKKWDINTYEEISDLPLKRYEDTGTGPFRFSRSGDELYIDQQIFQILNLENNEFQDLSFLNAKYPGFPLEIDDEYELFYALEDAGETPYIELWRNREYPTSRVYGSSITNMDVYKDSSDFKIITYNRNLRLFRSVITSLPTEIEGINFNVSENKIIVENNGNDFIDADLILTDINGKTLRNEKINVRTGITEKVFDLPNGTYLIRISTNNNQILSHKFQIVR